MFTSVEAQQPEPPTPQALPEIHVDLSGLAESIWRWLIDHIGELGQAILTPLESALREASHAIWNAIWDSSLNFITQIPPDVSYNFGAYKAIATDPVPLAVGGATLALVLLGLRTLAGAITGTDHTLTHVITRLIPAVFLTLAYPALIERGIGLVNTAAKGLGFDAIGGGIVSGIGTLMRPPPGMNPFTLPYVLLWLVLLYFGIRLLIRLTYSLLRLMVALVFGPVALILWAIPQTEWVTWFWLRELIGWATTPLLVTACLAIAVPLASGRDGYLVGAAFGIAGFQAAHDLVGALAFAHRSSTVVGSGTRREMNEIFKVAAEENRASLGFAPVGTTLSSSVAVSAVRAAAALRNQYGA